MLKNQSITLTLRLLCVAAVSAALAACGGGSGASGSALPPAAGVGEVPLATSVASAPSAVQSASGSSFAPSSITVTFPSAPAAGHTIVVALWNNGNTSGAAIKYAAPAGWSLVDLNSSHSYHGYEVFSHVVASGESNKYVFTPTYAQREHVWTAVEVANTSGVEKHANAYVSGSTFTTPTLYPSASNDLALALNMPQASGASWTNPSGWTREVGPTSTWSGQGMVQNLSSTSGVSESAKLSTSSTGFAGILLFSPSASSGATTSSTATPSATSAPATTASTAPSTAPSVAQWSNGSAFAPSSITVKYPSTPAAGHLLVVAFWNNGQSGGAANTYTAPAGWALVNQNTSHSYMTYQVFSHIVAAGEANSYVFKPLSAAREHVWIAADSTASSVDKSGNNFVSSSTSFTTPSLAPAQSNELALALNLPDTNSSVTWTNPSGWALGTGPTSTWHGEGMKASLASTSTVSESAKLSAASSGFAGVVLLSPSQSSGTISSTPAPTAAPTSAPTTSPTTSPTSAPVPAGVASYHGCRLYPANDWFTTNLINGGSSYASNAIDPNSGNYVNNFNNAFPNDSFNGPAAFTSAGVNVETGSNLKSNASIGNLSYGYANDPYNDNPSPHHQPITTGTFMQEGTRGCTSSSGDCHVVTLNTQTCVDYETFNFDGASWNGSSYTAEGGGVENLNHPYAVESMTVTQADLPLLGTTDFGEDLSYQQSSCQPNCAIPHILGWIASGTDATPKATGGYVSPAGYGKACSSNCSYPIPMGARLRLKSSYSCPSPNTNPQANLVCNQLKQYGMILTDHEGTGYANVLRFGVKSDGSNPWNSSDLGALLSNLRITNFDVMKVGTIR